MVHGEGGGGRGLLGFRGRVGGDVRRKILEFCNILLLLKF